MKDLFSLIQCLTTREWESLQNYLSCFSTHADDENGPKQLQLARILKQETSCPTDARCSLKIYGIKDAIGIEMLKSRLKEKTLDFLLTDISRDKKQELDEVDYAIVKLNKKAAQFRQLYFSKKRIPLLGAMLDEIIFESKEYEQYFLLTDHLRHKRNLVSFKNGKAEYEKINKKIADAQKCSVLYNKAEQYYFELAMMNDYNAKQNKQVKLVWLKKIIAEIETENQDIKSSHVDYSLTFLKIEYYQLIRDYASARSTCTDLLDIVRNNKSVYRRQRIGIAYDTLSQCDHFLGNFEQAAEWAQQAQKHFNPNSENYCIALEQEFYALFAMKEYDKAVGIANKMLSSATSKELGEFRFSKYNYLLANALFKQNKFTETLYLLSQVAEISKDKSGWEIGARLLKIMTLVEMLKLDDAGLAVFSLKQFFKRIDKRSGISVRDKKILNLLLIAERAGFTFSTLNGNTDEYMKYLTSSDKDKRWEPFTHELIPFHEWFAGKMGKKIETESVLAPAKKAKKVSAS